MKNANTKRQRKKKVLTLGIIADDVAHITAQRFDLMGGDLERTKVRVRNIFYGGLDEKSELTGTNKVSVRLRMFNIPYLLHRQKATVYDPATTQIYMVIKVLAWFPKKKRNECN